MRFLNTILDIVFPVNCMSCGKSGSDLCIACLADAPPAERESAKWVFPIFDYRHPPIKKALWLLKYKGKKRFANIFAEIMHGRILEELSELSVMENFREPLLIPIPLSPKRYRERGYNQAELICREIVKLQTPSPSALPLRRGRGNMGEVFPLTRGNEGVVFGLLTNILIKPKETEHQARIHNRSKRLKNIIGSFAIKDEMKDTGLLKGKNVILVDDITTTGATLNEARKILKQAGAKKIIAFTVAH